MMFRMQTTNGMNQNERKRGRWQRTQHITMNVILNFSKSPSITRVSNEMTHETVRTPCAQLFRMYE